MWGVRIWEKRSRLWWVHPLKQSTWANESSPTPAGLGMNKHRIKLVPRIVVDSCMAGADWGVIGSAPGFIPTACTAFLGNYSLWMDTLLSLDIVGRPLDLPQSNVPHCLWWVDAGWVGGKWGGEGVETWIGMYNGKGSFLSLIKKEKRKCGTLMQWCNTKLLKLHYKSCRRMDTTK